MAAFIAYAGEIKQGSTSRFISVILNSAKAAHTDYTCKYVREGDAAATSVTLDAGTAGAYGAGGQLIKIDQDIFQFSLPDAALAAGARRVTFKFHDAATPNLWYFIYDLTAVDKNDGVRMGLTALPNAAADAAGGLPISDAGGLDLDAVLSGNTPQTGDNYARLGAPAGVSIAADLAAIEAQTDDIGNAGAGLTAVPWNPAWDAEVQSECTDALNAYDPPTRAELTSDVNSVLAAIAGLDVAALTAVAAAIKERTDRLPDVPASRGDVTSIAAGAGADAVTLTVTVGGVPVADANVWITSDEDGNTLVAGTKLTNTQGEVTFLLEDGVTYFMWAQKDGVLDAQGTMFVAEAD